MSGFHVTMLLLFLVIVFYICKSGALAQGSPSFSEESFTEYALEAAKALYPEQQWTKKDVLVLQANKAGTIYLYNLFREVGSKAPQLRAVTTCLYLKKLVETMTDSSDIDDWSAIKNRIYPRLVQYSGPGSIPEGMIVDRCSFSDKLAICYYVPCGELEYWASSKLMSNWKIENSELRAAALSNLQEKAKQADFAAKSGRPTDKGGWIVSDDPSYILLPTTRNRLRAALGDGFYAAMSNRNCLMCWSANFGAADLFKKQLHQDFQREPNPLTNDIFVVKGNELTETSLVLR